MGNERKKYKADWYQKNKERLDAKKKMWYQIKKPNCKEHGTTTNKILELIKKEELTVTKIAKVLDMEKSLVKYHLNKLLMKNEIIRVGSNYTISNDKQRKNRLITKEKNRLKAIKKTLQNALIDINLKLEQLGHNEK